MAPPQKPRETVQARPISPERDDFTIRFPRVLGYRVELPSERLEAAFTDDSTFVLTHDLIGPTRTRNEGIIGKRVDLDLDRLGDLRPSTLVYHLTHRLLETKWRDPGAEASCLHGRPYSSLPPLTGVGFASPQRKGCA